MKGMNRRRFLSESIKGAAGLSLGMAAVSKSADKPADANSKPADANSKPAKTPAPSANAAGANERVVLAIIGAGNYGTKVITRMIKLPNVQVKYACDVNDERGAGTIKTLEESQGFAPKRIVDMREALDDKEVNGVLISTPEHWHALATIWACQAGKDVYVEKPIAISLWESRKMVEAARKYKRIVQCGTQNRSADYAYTARDYIKSGKLGKVLYVKVYSMLLADIVWNPQPDSPAPKGLDWDRWLGPAVERPYNPYMHKRWSNYWAFGTGNIGHDATHQIDLARIAMGDPMPPKTITCIGGRLAYNDKRDVPDTQAVTYEYGDFVMTLDLACFTPYLIKAGEKVRLGDKWPDWATNGDRIEIYGTDRIMYLGRMGAGWQIMERKGKGDDSTMEVIDQQHGKYPSEPHEANFIDCIRTRKTPNGNIEQGHYSNILVNAANISYRVGNKQLAFDSKSETFTNCKEANDLLKPAYRKNYRIPDQV